MDKILPCLIVFVWIFLLMGCRSEQDADHEREADQRKPETVEQCIQALTGEHDPYAFRRLVTMGDTAVEYIDENFDGLDVERKYRALEVLGEVRSHKAIEAIIDHTSTSELGDWPCRLLYRIGEKAIPQIVKRYGSRDLEGRRALVRILAIIGGEKALDALVAKYHEEKGQELRIDLMLAIGSFHDERAVGILTKEADSTDVFRARTAIHLLSMKLQERFDEVFVPILRNPKKDIRIRVTAAGALAKLRDPEGMGFLKAQLKDPDLGIRSHAIFYIGETGDRSFADLLIKELTDESQVIRASAALALGKTGDEKVVRLLISASYDNEASVRKSAAIALGRIGDRRALIRLLFISALDKDENVRIAARRSYSIIRQKNSED